MAGSREAHGIVTALLSRGCRVIASLPEPERTFDALPVPTRMGGFASPDTLAGWMQENRVAKVIDASHGFDNVISEMAAAVCKRLGLKYLRVLRPVWRATSRDRWQPVPSIKHAAQAVPAGARVFTNTGWPTLPDYAAFGGQRLFMRQMHAPSQPAPFPFVEFVEGRPPFSQFQEEALFRRLRVTHLICRNVGGAASMSKLLAARAMEIPVFMVARSPAPAHLPVVETVTEALAWQVTG
jgi:precorrin-6A/cobalt-precorrin-6A reductase